MDKQQDASTVLNRFTVAAAGAGFLAGVTATAIGGVLFLSAPKDAHKSFNTAVGNAYQHDPKRDSLQAVNGVMSVPAARDETISFGYIGPKGPVAKATLTLVDTKGNVVTHEIVNPAEEKTASLSTPAP